MMRLGVLALIACLALPGAGGAQDLRDSAAARPPAPLPTSLVADQVYISADGRLVAEGHVDVAQGQTRLTASRIVYDQEAGTLSIDGPIRIDDGRGVTILASSADMDDTLQSGLLTSARLVFNDQVQLAAARLSRSGGRYSQLLKTAVTSCHVCEDGKPPLWQIRARKVIHDQKEKQLYFEDAQLRVLTVPVLYLPRLRLPDPTLKRARGFLIPEVQTTSQLGTGLKVPYFIPLGAHADLTLAPYWSPKTRTLDFRYRQAFWNGAFEFEGALSRDDLIRGDMRGYLFGVGAFDFRNDYKLKFDIAAASDDAYLRDYGISDADRLSREISLTRTDRDRFFGAAIVNYTSLRANENDDFLPTIIGDIRHDQRFFPARLGGEIRTSVIGHGHARSSSADGIGRDIARASAEAEWQRTWILGNGLRADFRAGLAGDLFLVRQDSTVPADISVITPRTALKLSRPMRRATGKAMQILEPLVQVAWSDVSNRTVPNDESNLVEFDEGNLLSLSRFPAEDRREDGLVLAYGLNWAHQPLTAGWEAHASFGQVLRQETDFDFTKGSGLSGNSSDFLVAGQVIYGDNLSLTARTTFDESLNFSKAELRGGWRRTDGEISGTYLWLDADPAEGRTQDSSEFYFDGAYQVAPNWTASANWRYDIAAAGTTTAGFGLGYRNECVAIDLSVNRNFTSSTNVEPSTIFGLTISLRGFGIADGEERYASSCRKS
ncbi:MAG: LPS-assembly protein LptD [Marinibacterium sp.]